MSELQQLPLSPKELVQLNLQQQGLLTLQTGPEGVLHTIKQLGYVQIDSIHVVERAHHHVLHNRVADYQPQWLAQLLEQQQIFEYWSHAAAYLPMADYRFSLYRKAQLQGGKKHWFAKDDAQMQLVRAKIRAEGPLKAADFAKPAGAKTGGWWNWQPAKQALEQLFMQGELMVVRRENFQKVYDLTENVLPSNLNCQVPTTEEYAEHLIMRYLQSHAFGTASQISYLRPEMKKPVQQLLQEFASSALIASFQFAGQRYYWLPSLSLTSAAKESVHLLNPFDNLVIQRQRLQHWFDFDYQIEVYVPAERRKIGYYSLPMLFHGQMVGQVDVKACRKTGVLFLQNFVLQDQMLWQEQFAELLKQALQRYAKFNGCHDIALVRASSPALTSWLQSQVLSA